MSVELFVCSINHRVCKDKKRRKVGENAQKFLLKVAETQKDNLITAALSTVTSVWVLHASYKRCTRPRNVNKTVNISGECAGDQPNQSVDLFYLVTERIV